MYCHAYFVIWDIVVCFVLFSQSSKSILVPGEGNYIIEVVYPRHLQNKIKLFQKEKNPKQEQEQEDFKDVEARAAWARASKLTRHFWTIFKYCSVLVILKSFQIGWSSDMRLLFCVGPRSQGKADSLWAANFIHQRWPPPSLHKCHKWVVT